MWIHNMDPIYECTHMKVHYNVIRSEFQAAFLIAVI